MRYAIEPKSPCIAAVSTPAILRGLLALAWTGCAAYLAFRDWDPHRLSYLSLFFRGAPVFAQDIGAAFYRLFSHGLRELGYLAVYVPAAAGAGRLVLAWIHAPADRLSRFALALVLGQAVLGFAAFVLGLLGLYNAVGIWSAAIALAFFAVCGLGFIRELLREPSRPVWSPAAIVLICMLTPIAIFLLAKALWPAVHVDAITYHLGLPNYYIQEGGLTYVPYDMCSAYPPLAEMLYTLGMLVAGQKAAQFTSVAMLLTTVLLVYAVTRNLFGARYAPLCAAACLLSPGFMDAALVYGNDLTLAYFTLSAIYCFMLWRKHRQISGLVLVGIAAGAALSVKYTAFVFIPPLIIAGCAFDAFVEKSGLRTAAARMLLCMAVAGIVCLPWMMKNMLVTGNPVYPVLFSVLGGEDMNAEMYATAGRWGGAVEEGAFFTTLAGTIQSFFLFSTNYFETRGMLGNIGLLPLFFLPALLLIHRRGAATALLLCAALITLLQSTSFALSRYYYPATLLLLIVAAYAATALYCQSPRFLKPFIAGAIGLCLLLNTGMGMHQANRRTKTHGFDFIHESDERHLLRHMFGNPEAFLDSYPLNVYANRHLSPGACVLIVGDVQHLYLQRRHRYTYLSATTPYGPFANHAGDHRALARRLVESGITHIQYNPRELRRLQDVGAIAWSAEDTHLIESFLNSPRVHKIYSFDFYGNESALYKIKRP